LKYICYKKGNVIVHTVKFASLVIGSFIGAASVAPAFAVTKSSAATLGYQDPETGVFHPLKTTVPDATTTPTTGTVKVTFNVKLATTFPKGTTLLCTASITAVVINTTAGTESEFSESVDDGVALSGTTATCSTTIPYSWLIPNTSGALVETFTGSYILSAVVATSTGAPATTGLVTRTSTGAFAAASTIPASGTSSTYTVNATL